MEIRFSLVHLSSNTAMFRLIFLNVGAGCILIQLPDGKRIKSVNSRSFGETEQKMSLLCRDLCKIVSALQTYEHYINGFLFPIHLYCYHIPVLYHSRRKGQLLNRLSKLNVTIPSFQNWNIFWISPSFPRCIYPKRNHWWLSTSPGSTQNLTRDIQFFDQHGQQVTYGIHHEDNPVESCNDFYPNHWQQGNDQKIVRLHNDGVNFFPKKISTDFATPSVQLAAAASEWDRL